MTTIAFDGRILATDTLVTGFHKSAEACKIFFGIDESDGEMLALAGCGAYAAMAPAFAWFIHDGKPENYPQNDLRLTAIKVKRGEAPVCILVEGTGRRLIVPPPHVDGSGGETAMGAMLAGKNAAEAVAIAGQVDPGTGGPTLAIDMIKGEWLRPPSEASVQSLAYLMGPYMAVEPEPKKRKRKKS